MTEQEVCDNCGGETENLEEHVFGTTVGVRVNLCSDCAGKFKPSSGGETSSSEDSYAAYREAGIGSEPDSRVDNESGGEDAKTVDCCPVCSGVMEEACNHQKTRNVECPKCGSEEKQPLNDKWECSECGHTAQVFKEDNSEIRLAEKFQGMTGSEIVDFIREKNTLDLQEGESSSDEFEYSTPPPDAAEALEKFFGDEPSQGESERTPSKVGGEPPKHLILLRCPGCERKRTVEPDNSLYKTGGYECPDCSELFKPVAKYEKVGEAHG